MPEMRKLLARFVESTDESLRKRTAQADPPGGITTPEYAREMTGSTSCRAYYETLRHTTGRSLELSPNSRPQEQQRRTAHWTHLSVIAREGKPENPVARVYPHTSRPSTCEQWFSLSNSLGRRARSRYG